jgi:hypothetical protein
MVKELRRLAKHDLRGSRSSHRSNATLAIDAGTSTLGGPMFRRTRWIGGGAIALAVIGGGASIAIATGGNDQDIPIAGSDLQKATAAALASTGGGSVIEAEAGDDGAAYGVEIRLDDGRVVEVSLDRNFAVIGSETDDDRSSADAAGDDD